nr:ribosome-binding factor A [Candidatus Gracilibacteria bacterium]
MKQERLNKLEAVAQELLSRIIFEEIEDSEKIFGIITILGTKISPDLSYLDVYISSFKNKEILAHTLARHGYDIQKRINKELPIRKLPKVRFRYNDEGEVAGNINKLINDLEIKD